MRAHFIGVGGSGMSAVAHLLAATGVSVTGSDAHRSSYFTALEQSGLDVRVGEHPELVDAADVVVVSTAIRETNPELQHARSIGKDVWHRSHALAVAVESKRVIAVAGSHGKTTTTALVTHMLHASGIDASCAIGAKLRGVTGAVAGAYVGASDVAVIEADESDGSFLRYRAAVAIITNIEPDHMDYHGTVDDLHAAFQKFASQAQTLVACVDDPVVRRIAAGRDPDAVFTYGSAASSGDPTASVVLEGDTLVVGADRLAWTLPVPGRHHQLNAAAAFLASRAMGASAQSCHESLSTFAGTSRRYEERGEAEGVRVVDDYAHHPTEVAAVLSAARMAGEGHLVVLFEPMLFSRTQLHARAFGEALSIDNADIVVAPVHGDREDPIPGVSSQSIVDAVTPGHGSSVVLARSLVDAAQKAAARARPGSLVLTLGSGPVTTMPEVILESVRELAHGRA